MPFGYLWSVGIIAVSTQFALRPVRRPRALAGLSFRLGLLVSELPFIALFWLCFSTALAFGQGDIDSPAAAAVAGLAGLTAVGLAVVIRRGLQARSAIDDALTAGLGPGWRTDLATQPSARTPQRLPWPRILFRPFIRRHGGVERIANLRYGDAGKRNQLDVFCRRDRPSGGPVFIHLHGGGYYSGRKNSQSLPLLYRLAAQGWVCISANYRLRPAAQHRTI